jgi:hypothetical protein
MNTRTVLAPRRESTGLSFEHDGVAYRATISRFEDGSIAELFLNAGKLGSAADKMAHDAAVIYSIARQYGVPERVLYDALTKLKDGSPAGPLGLVLALLSGAAT